MELASISLQSAQDLFLAVCIAATIVYIAWKIKDIPNEKS